MKNTSYYGVSQKVRMSPKQLTAFTYTITDKIVPNLQITVSRKDKVSKVIPMDLGESGGMPPP